MKRPVWIWGTGTLACLLIAAYLPQAAFWLPAAILFFLGFIFWVRSCRQWAVCCVLAGLLALLLYNPARLAMAGIQYRSRRVLLKGQVCQVTGREMDGYTAVVKVSRVNDRADSFRILCEGLPEAVPGQHIRVSVLVESLAGTPGCRQWYADDIFTKGTRPRDFLVTGLEKGLRYRLYCYQKRLSGVLLAALQDETGGTLAAMTVGDRTALAPAVSRDYRAAGLPHVLVVSGLHLMIFCGLGDISKSTIYVRVFHGLRGMVLALFYMGLTGLQPSVLRAGVMAVFQCVGLLCTVPVDPLTSLALSGVLLSFVTPWAVCDIAFQLSACACLGVLWAADRFERGFPPPMGQSPARKCWRSLCQQLAVSCGAALFVLPVQLGHGLALRPLGIITNLACFLLVGPVIRWGIFAAVVACIPGLRGAAQLFLLAAGCLTRLLNAIAAGFAAFSIGWQAAGFLAVLLFGTVAGLAALGTRFFWPAAAGAALSACLMAGLVLGVSAWQQGSVTVTLLGDAKTPSVVVMQDGEALVVYQGGRGTASAIREFLACHQVSTIRQVVDLRPAGESECPLSGQQTYSLLWDEAFELTPLHPLSDVTLVYSRFETGGAAAVICGKTVVWIYQGRVPAGLGAASIAYLAAGQTHPGPLQDSPCVLTLTPDHPWLAGIPASRVRCAAGQLTIRLWPRSQAEKVSAN